MLSCSSRLLLTLVRCFRWSSMPGSRSGHERITVALDRLGRAAALRTGRLPALLARARLLACRFLCHLTPAFDAVKPATGGGGAIVHRRGKIRTGPGRASVRQP